MKKYRVGIIGATGMVGQRFVMLLYNHAWYDVKVLAASSRSAGRTYADAVGNRWAMESPVPDSVKGITVLDAENDFDRIVSEVDFVFCAIDMSKDETRALEERYARAECPVISNNSAHRSTPDVPMLIPEVNSGHAEIIHAQRKRLGTKKGFIAVKSNCSIQSYVPALHPLKEKYGLNSVLTCTYQAISGASKTFETWPEIVDNVIPFIGGEEEKSEKEPLKIWGEIKGDEIIAAAKPFITTQCIRIPATDGHLAAVFFSLEKKAEKDEIIKLWKEFKGKPQELKLPSAPKQFIHYFEEDDRPQTRLDRGIENGMAISAGRLREDDKSSPYDYKFICLSHNTIRGAAGGAVLAAELLTAMGYMN
ncbi:MAG: aspartate-semialdehyde dehydrogenase [Oscillospiraceae bacterium]|nr:aspartate-semialdehyde dehydrogenase [Oscillospiraceae bacterium]